MQPLVFALIAYFTWGIGILFEAIVGQKIESKSYTFWALLLGFILSLFYAPFVLSELNSLTISTILVNLFVAFFFIFGTVIYYDALKKGNPSLVGTIASSFPFVIVVLSIIFLGEKIDNNQLIAIVIIFIGLLLSSLNIREIRKEKKLFGPGVILALITMLSWGIALTFIKIPISKIGWFWPNFFIFSLFPVFLLYMKLTGTGVEFPKTRGILLPLILSIILVRTAEFSYNIGISKGYASIVAPIAGANPTLFVLLSFLVFKQSITKRQILGIVVTVTGIVLLSVFSVI